MNFSPARFKSGSVHTRSFSEWCTIMAHTFLLPYQEKDPATTCVFHFPFSLWWPTSSHLVAIKCMKHAAWRSTKNLWINICQLFSEGRPVWLFVSAHPFIFHACLEKRLLGMCTHWAGVRARGIPGCVIMPSYLTSSPHPVNWKGQRAQDLKQE